MARTATHTFHTRHDFTPELGWAAFQLVHELGRAGLPEGGLEEAARATTSPLARRLDLTKILASLEDLGIIGRTGEGDCPHRVGPCPCSRWRCLRNRVLCRNPLPLLLAMALGGGPGTRKSLMELSQGVQSAIAEPPGRELPPTSWYFA